MQVDRIEVPERTVADKAFPTNVTLINDGAARTVYLFAALYEPAEGGADCGPATDARFRTFTHLVQEAVDVPARASLRYPPEGGAWLQRYQTDDTPSGGVAQLCVFVANASTGPLIDYESFGVTDLSVRDRNAPPAATFAWTPEVPAATKDATFTAEATDTDGDPVTFAWDFGHFAATGRAAGAGAVVAHAFYPAGEFVVTLTATDGLDETRVTHTITVVAASDEVPLSPTSPPRETIPLSLAVACGALLVAAFMRRS